MAASDIAAVTKIETDANRFPWSLKNFNDGLTARHESWVFCNENGTIVGFTVLQKVVDELHLLNICVSIEQQGRGIGKVILKSVVEYADAIGSVMILLEVRRSNNRAQQLYLKSGFNEMAVRKGYYPAEQGREDAILMAMTLSLESFLTDK
jgi:ribosomal-protein-alanine N-acetyltransferase